MLRIWLHAKREALPVHLMMHDHDALTFMFPEDREADVVPMLKQMLIEAVPLAQGRALRIPYDCKTGWNKGDYDAKDNPDGLKDYVGKDKRTRTPPVGLMDRVFHRKYARP